MTPIAWTPLLKPQLVPLVAIHAYPNQVLDRDIYLSQLSSRIQRMVNACPNPKTAVKEFLQTMFEEGLVKDIANCPPQEAGTNLIVSNSEVWDILSNLGVFQSLTKAKPPLVANLMAHQALSLDLNDPLGRLKTWATLMAREA
jgi:hypothetical protein